MASILYMSGGPSLIRTQHLKLVHLVSTAYIGNRVRHTIDSAYTPMIEQALINGILEARKNLVPARLGVGWGFSNANINRRAIDVDGKASIGLNPDGPVDRRIGLLRIDKRDGSPIALIANYPIHGTVLGEKSLQISGDAPGIVSQYVEEKIGAPVLFINGAAGNLAPIYSVYPTPASGHLSQFRVLLGDKILEANKKITSTMDTVHLFAGELTVETPRKPGLGWSADMSRYTAGKAGINMVRLPIRFLKINEEVAIWSAPIELFCEISNEVRDRSPFPFTFYFGYTNGWFGYLPNAAAWPHGGYEVEAVSPFTTAADQDVTEAVVDYLQGVMRNPESAKKSEKEKVKNWNIPGLYEGFLLKIFMMLHCIELFVANIYSSPLHRCVTHFYGGTFSSRVQAIFGCTNKICRILKSKDA